MKKVVLIAVFAIVLGAGGFFGYRYLVSSAGEEIRISTNPWVGFTPFIYAQEKGWLENSPFKFVWLVDLTDNARLYERGFTRGFTATQYELLHFKNPAKIKPVFLIDRSAGADGIVSNLSIEELKKTHQKVKVYLERDSLNEDLFSAFVRENHFEAKQFELVDATQKNITTVPLADEPKLIVTYEPYLSVLRQKGFKMVGSTREFQSFYVIDALFVDERYIEGREADFAALKAIYVKGLEQLRNNPKEYYETIKGYLEGQSYEEFIHSTTQIEWLDKAPPRNIIETLNAQRIQTDKLLP